MIWVSPTRHGDFETLRELNVQEHLDISRLSLLIKNATRTKPAVWMAGIATAFLAACGGGDVSTDPDTPSGSSEEFKIGLILVGPKEDAGWSQAHFEGVEYVIKNMPNATFDFADRINPADRPNLQAAQVADDLIDDGADMIIFNSDDHKDDALATAQKHPDIAIIHSTGDYAWEEGQNFKDQPNLGNVMVQMEYGRAIAGCAAALTTEEGKIGFLGPLINDETRRLVSAAYLGADYCWQVYRNQNPSDLAFKVSWIGFWFNIPGVTLDPTQVADSFFNDGYDVVMTGIDTPEVATQAAKAAEAGKDVKFLHYTLPTGCDLAPDICVGVPTYNWGPSYLEAALAAAAGSFEGEFVWAAPNWSDLNDVETSAVGFKQGDALSDTDKEFLNEFIARLGDGSIDLYEGPLQFQDGSEFVAAGETATLEQIWYMPQLLKGIEGPSE